MEYSDKYLAFMGMWPKKIPHWEHWSCPDAETYLTGIDYYEHPKLCREKLHELYPQFGLHVPVTDDPIPLPETDPDPVKHTVRWGDSVSRTWVHGQAFFKTPEDVFRFSPLEHPNLSDWPHVVEVADYSSADIF